ncbi:cuticlin-4-like isoform X1 [Argiope bruennichi]|uniref:cuticlin-4-like isoform X1 n=1 Tax=Argiope bruennichi TaxID=94029 RepID=UPI00249440EC|nr:cuticlin-4-like isoform X1 [Argiope bruennichi]
MKSSILLAFLLTILASCHGRHNDVLTAVGNKLSDVDIECNSDSIEVTISTSGEEFNGMVYPKGLSENSSCLAEYEHAGSKITYKLPLRSCNTMSHDISEGVEYFNTVVIQPHSKLVTSLGRGFHVRCRYQNKNKTLHSEAPSNSIGTTPAKNAVPLPTCSMHIYVGRPSEHVIAEHARIGEYLTLVISIEEQDTYGLKVTNCIVKDGLGWSEQPLINNDGCPIDSDVMGPFEYSKNLTLAQVTYPAHKFPFTASVYYKCNVKLCTKKNGGCDDVPPICDPTGHNVRRRRRKRQSGELQDRGSLEKLRLQDEDVRDKSVEVYGGLYVNEVDDDEDSENPSTLPARSDDEFCVSTRKFAIGIAIAGVLLMLAVILLVACIVHRRRRRKGTSTTGSSIYSGPYSNHAYSRD